MAENIYVVGNKVDIPDNECISKHESEGILLFVGKMDYEPNVIAVTSFAECILPNLLITNSELQFQIVGAHPDIRVRQLVNSSNIQVTGFVESIEPYYQNATIVVAPMLTGAGIQNKIIQAMSYGCCVVTTPIGAEGLTINHNEIAVWKSDNEMIDGINDLLTNREKRIVMGRKARQYVIDNLSTGIIAQQFWAFMDGAFDKRAQNYNRV